MLFDSLCEQNAVTHNPVDGVKRPKANNNEGLTPALGDAQARVLLAAPPGDTLKGKRDRAILATLLYHGIRREELCKLKVKDVQQRDGVVHLRVEGKGGKSRFIPAAIRALRLIQEYLEEAGHTYDIHGPLFRPVKNNTTGDLNKPLNPSSVYRNIVRHYGKQVGITLDVHGSACTRCAQRRRPMRSSTRRTSPRSRIGWGTPTSPPRACTTSGRTDPRIARRSRWSIEKA